MLILTCVCVLLYLVTCDSALITALEKLLVAIPFRIFPKRICFPSDSPCEYYQFETRNYDKWFEGP